MQRTPILQQDPETYKIIGAAMEVHRQLGCGFLEAVYQEALGIEFANQQIPHQREAALDVLYKGYVLKCSYRADFICYEQIIVEVKTTGGLTGIDEAQVINYLKTTGFHRALLLNFGAKSLEYKRLVL